ncbi:MAG: uroporphyrinogen-III synthase [Gammaproteobacteria bacterium]
MTRRLDGAGIVVTRPTGAADRLAQLLAAAGARLLAFPAFRLVPIETSVPAGDFDAALFTSPAAVRFGWAHLAGARPKTLLAPGSGTRASLVAAGATEVQIPARGAGLAALLDSLSADWLTGKRLLVVCGEPPNRANLRELEALSAAVTPFPVYARRAAQDARPLSAWIRAGEVDAIMASSVAAVAVLDTLLGENSRKLDWIVSSERVAGEAERRGVKPFAVAASAEAGDMAAAAVHWWQSKDAHDRRA